MTERTKKEKPGASHEEILTKWWKIPDGDWSRVTVYDPYSSSYRISIGTVSKGWFANKKSANIPPEGNHD